MILLSSAYIKALCMPVEIPVHFVYSHCTVLYHRFIEAYLFLISLRFTATIIIITILNFSLPSLPLQLYGGYYFWESYDVQS